MNLFGTPYEHPAYLLLFAAAAAPLIIALACGKRLNLWEVAVSIGFLYLIYGGSGWAGIAAPLCYTAWQLLLACGYSVYRKKYNRGLVFYTAIALSLLPLLFMKFLPFITGHRSFWAFLGISYLTFRALQTLMEMRDGLIGDFRPLRYLRFLLFFPAIAAGPIDRYRHFCGAISAPPGREAYGELLGRGINRIFLGCLYKYIIAHYLHIGLNYAEKYAVDSGLSVPWLLITMYAYSLYLFFDFAGYSLFAAGAGNIMGYDTPMNFRFPFKSSNIKDFWNRWHISLSFWFRDYVYMRLLFVFTKRKVFRSKVLASNLCYFMLFLLMGLWHGVTWYYLAYGVWHAALICLNDAWLRFRKRHKERLPSNRLTLAVSTVLTFHAVCFGFLIFSGILEKLV
ncbi:MAG: D-alanyl-lipoteichoic acid biosynthesis protein DltB [Clostridiales Family XIII bacterium]|jgi:membrane protein involved in D-alanine export|nr:D-alanyl-lipoteichoic acid biosynthesis protein DltB [Clostridiales Family XIII bacterium]